MVLISPYKSSRVLGADFLKGAVEKHKMFTFWTTARPWAHGILMWCGDVRILISVMTAYYYVGRYHVSRVAEDEYQRTMIKRWGNSLENVRMHLTPGDQVRVRTYIEYEQYKGVFLHKDEKFRPDGMPWPAEAGH